MKLSEFILLDKSEKQSALLHHGVLVAKRKECESMLFLFQLKSFYVEASFAIFNKEIERFVVSSSPTILSPYLESIRVDELLN